MTIGEELVLRACEKELRRLIKTEKKAKQKWQERMNIVTESIAIHKKFCELLNSDLPSSTQLKEINALKDREKRVKAIEKKDVLKLMNKESEANIKVHALSSEIETMKWRHKLNDNNN